MVISIPIGLMCAVLPESFKAYHKASNVYTYNPEKAKELLKEACGPATTIRSRCLTRSPNCRPKARPSVFSRSTPSRSGNSSQ